MPVITPTSTSYTYIDQGGCNCPHCSPCALPATSLTATLTNLAGSAAATLVYSRVPPDSIWTSACTLEPGGGSWRFTIVCRDTGCTWFHLAQFDGDSCEENESDKYYQITTECLDGNANSLTLVSYTCSPINIVFGIVGVSTITITP